MFHGPPLPLSLDVRLNDLLTYSRPHQQLGAWIRGSLSRLHIYQTQPRPRRTVLVSNDLGVLLSRCNEIAVREGERTTILAAETIVHWRALQVATATPYLPGLERLRELLPRLSDVTSGFLVPLRKESPEEVLALCRQERVCITGSRIVYVRTNEREGTQE